MFVFLFIYFLVFEFVDLGYNTELEMSMFNGCIVNLLVSFRSVQIIISFNQFPQEEVPPDDIIPPDAPAQSGGVFRPGTQRRPDRQISHHQQNQQYQDVSKILSKRVLVIS